MKSMQLVAGLSAQEYNQRKGRKGAFWEDRYHATAVDSEMRVSAAPQAPWLTSQASPGNKLAANDQNCIRSPVNNRTWS